MKLKQILFAQIIAQYRKLLIARITKTKRFYGVAVGLDYEAHRKTPIQSQSWGIKYKSVMRCWIYYINEEENIQRLHEVTF